MRHRQDGGRPPSWICDGDWSKRCSDIGIFQLLKMADAAILHFQNVGILGVERVKSIKIRHCAKFRGNRPKLLLLC